MSCEQLHAFVDGELTPAEADAYRDHLAECATCQAELPKVMALLGLLETATESGAGRDVAPTIVERAPPTTTIVERAPTPTPPPIVERAPTPPPPSIVEHAPPPPPPSIVEHAPPPPPPSIVERAPAPVVPLRSRRRVAIVGALFAAAAGVALWLPTRSHRGGGGGGHAVEVATLIPAGRPRPSLARFAYGGAAAYRPYDPTRGATGDAELVPLAIMASLEQRGDWHGLGVASLIRGDRAQAARYLARAPSTPDVEADRAALALIAGDDAALADALAALDRVLVAHPDHAAAAWNRAQILARLGLPEAAAAGFDRIVAQGEPDWSVEATRTAAELRAGAAGEKADWNADWDAGKQMLDGTLPPAGRAAARPGIFRVMFYDAVRSAPTAARVRALRPIAAELDGVAGGDTLTALVDRVAALDFARRAPLAARYRPLVDHVKLAPEGQARLLGDLRKAGPLAADLYLGALYWLDGAQTRHADYDRLAAASRDPWFAAFAAHRRALAAIGRGQLAAAAAILVPAIRDAVAARVHYRAELLELELASLYLELDRRPAAAELARAAMDRARAGGEWGHVIDALPVLAEISLRRFQLALARGYLEEEAARAPDECMTQRQAHILLAQAAIFTGERDRARRELALAKPCDQPPAVAAIAIGVALSRQGGTAADVTRLRAELATLRASPGLSEPDAIFADLFEGALLIEHDLDGGTAALRAVIDRAEHALDRVETRSTALRSRTWAFALLAVAAARRDDFGAVVTLLAEHERAPAPTRCAVALAVDDERLVVAGRGADGRALGHLDGAWPYPDAAPPDAAALVPADLRAALTGCAEVEVFALPPLEGLPRLLPSTLAWSYRQAPGRVAPSAVPPLRVRVSGVASPGALGLAPLAPVDDPDDHTAIVELGGASATPARVLAAIPDATEIELHTHGLRDREQSDASYLVLAPDPDGDYALTANRLAGVVLRGAPIVTLAACGGARGEPYLHQADSLPAAFVRAGARAVLATPDDVPDDAATRFFAGVRRRIAAGTAPAAALRDERIEWLGRDSASWTQDVLLYR